MENNTDGSKVKDKGKEIAPVSSTNLPQNNHDGVSAHNSPAGNEDQTSASLLSRIGASAKGLASDILGGGSGGSGGEGMRNDAALLAGRKASGGRSGSGRENRGGAEIGLAGEMKGFGGGGSESRIGSGRKKEGTKQGEGIRNEISEHQVRSEREFSDFLDAVPQGGMGEFEVEDEVLGADGSMQLEQQAQMGEFQWEKIWSNTRNQTQTVSELHDPSPETQSRGAQSQNIYNHTTVPIAGNPTCKETTPSPSPSPSLPPSQSSVPLTDIQTQQTLDGSAAVAILGARYQANDFEPNLDHGSEYESRKLEQEMRDEHEHEREGEIEEQKIERVWGVSREQRERITGMVRETGTGTGSEESCDLSYPHPYPYPHPHSQSEARKKRDFLLLPDFSGPGPTAGRDRSTSTPTPTSPIHNPYQITILPHDKEWIREWEEILNTYTDEVWGNSSPLVKEAREELEAAKEKVDSNEMDIGDMQALRRLRGVLRHLAG